MLYLLSMGGCRCRSVGSGNSKEKKKQGYNAQLDESLGMRDGRGSSKSQSMKSRRDESKGEEKKLGRRSYAGVKGMDKKRRKKY